MINTKPKNSITTNNQLSNSNQLPLIMTSALINDQLTKEANGIKIKNDNAEEEDKEANEEGDEEEEEEESEGEDQADKPPIDNHSNSQIDYKQKESEYIAHIEQLENELQIEKQITKTIQSDPAIEKEISTLKKQLESKTSKLLHLSETNKKQQAALTTLSHELESQTENERIRKYPLTQGNRRLQRKLDKDPREIVLKVKDKELTNALTLIDILSKDNTQMKQVIYSSKDYQAKLESIDNSKLQKDQIAKLNKEIQLLNKQLEDHQTCMLIEKDYIANLKQIQNELKEARSEQLLLKEKLSQMNGMNTNTDQTTSSVGLHLDKKNKSLSIRKKDPSNVNSSNILVKRNIELANGHNKVNHLIIMNPAKPKSIITSEDKAKLESQFSNKEEYEDFMRKINRIEKYKTTLEPKHKIELRELEQKVEELQKRVETLTEKCKESESRNKVYCYQINESKNNQKILRKKWNDFQKQLESIKNKSKDKDKDIHLLTQQLNALRRIVKQGGNNKSKCDIANYISKIQKEAEEDLDDDEDEMDNDQGKAKDSNNQE